MLTTLSVCPAAPDRDFLAIYYTLTENSDWRLDFDGEVYTLAKPADKLSLTLDFRRGKYRYRAQHAGKEPLAQAVKIKKKLPDTVFDATPGVLKDSLMLASRGIHVTACERNPLVFALVRQALSVLENDELKARIDYHFGDAGLALAQLPATDIIYLDPMYPPPQNAKKSAQVKKDMQVLHDVVGTDSDAAQLFAAARRQPARLVVKRPSYAEPLADIAPSFVSQTGSTRFDVYLPC